MCLSRKSSPALSVPLRDIDEEPHRLFEHCGTGSLLKVGKRVRSTLLCSSNRRKSSQLPANSVANFAYERP